MAIDPGNAVPRARRAKSHGLASIPVLHGPNLNLPGSREPGICGRRSLAEIGAGPGVPGYEFAVARGFSGLDG